MIIQNGTESGWYATKNRFFRIGFLLRGRWFTLSDTQQMLQKK